MRIAHLDVTPEYLAEFRKACENIYEIEEILSFNNSEELISHIEMSPYPIDLIFMEIELDGIDGFEVCEKINEMPSSPEIVFVCVHGRYAMNAFDIGAIGYILKPFSQDSVYRTIKRYSKLRGISEICTTSRDIYVKTFGRFDIFVDGKSIHFSNKKSKELLALLVDRRGGCVTMEQIIDTLWENRAFDDCTKTLYRTALKKLRDTLAEENISDILIESRGQRSIDVRKIRCDYYEFLKNPEKEAASFGGEYMFDYTWGEYTLAQIVKKCRKSF